MGRDAMITYDQVAAAAATLLAAGTKPSARGVREQLGHMGSMGTVHKLLQQWLVAQEKGAGEQLELPPLVERALLDFLTQRLEQGKASLRAALAELQREAAVLADENERLTAQIASQKEAAAEQDAELATLRGRQLQSEGALADASAELRYAQEGTAVARVDLAKALLRLEAMPRLEADLTSVRAELALERQARIVADQHAAVQAVQLEVAEARARGAEVLEAEVRSQIASNHDAMTLAASRLEKLQHIIAHLNGRIDAMQAQIGRQALALEKARQPMVAPSAEDGSCRSP